MEQYISKSAVAAELKRLQDALQDPAMMRESMQDYANGGNKIINTILSFLDTLETKEVDLEKELDKYTADNFWALDGNNESPYLVEKDDMLKVARHFYELGLKAKDVNEIIKTAEDHAYFAGSENTREKLIDKACKWWENNFTYPAMTSDEIEYYKSKLEDFRKAMEE